MDDIRFPSIIRYRFEAEAISTIELPRYPGSTWRGALGASLRRSACATGQPRCDGCLLRASCAFFQLFEAATPVQGGEVPTPSHPFVLDLPERNQARLGPGEPLALGINLIGEANRLLPNLILALELAGDAGIGRGGGRFRLRKVMQERTLSDEDWTPIFDAGERALSQLAPTPVPLPEPEPAVFVELLTPLRIKREGQLVGESAFTPADFLRHLCLRLDTLGQQFAAQPRRHWTAHRNLILAAGQEEVVELPRELRWLDWTRWSSRQRSRMQLGGLIGRFALPAATTAALWSLLWLGQWVHVGKATSFGLGAYRVRPWRRGTSAVP